MALVAQSPLNFIPSSVRKRKRNTQSPAEGSKRILLEELVTSNVIGTGSTKEERKALALRAAQRRHSDLMLSPSATIVEQRRMPPSSPEIYVSSHPKSHTNSIILREQAIDAQYAALRVFFDCLYATCGYIPWYYRKKFGILFPPRHV